MKLLFSDICNFTPLTTSLEPYQLVQTLNDLFGKFDDAAEVMGGIPPHIAILGGGRAESQWSGIRISENTFKCTCHWFTKKILVSLENNVAMLFWIINKQGLGSRWALSNFSL